MFVRKIHAEIGTKISPFTRIFFCVSFCKLRKVNSASYALDRCRTFLLINKTKTRLERLRDRARRGCASDLIRKRRTLNEMVIGCRSREETKFLALLAKSQEKASQLGLSKRTFQIKNGRRTRSGTGRSKEGTPAGTADDSSSQMSSSSEQIDERSPPEGSVDDWRLPKFVETLEKWLSDLERHPQ